MSQFEFLDNQIFINDAYEALSLQFSDKNDFLKLYNSLPNNQIKDDFLRIGSAYLFFVKSGDWHVSVNRSAPVINYFTNSFKLVSLLSIIESLENTKHLDFFQWLNKKQNKHLFPINREELGGYYKQYKKEYGAISNVIDFFCNLSEETQQKMRSHVTTVDGSPIESTELLVKLIYQARSKFAHSTKHTLEIGNVFHYSKYKGKMLVWRKFTMSILLDAVEEGIVNYFQMCNKVQITTTAQMV